MYTLDDFDQSLIDIHDNMSSVTETQLELTYPQDADMKPTPPMRLLLVDKHDLAIAILNAKKKAAKVGKAHTTSAGLKLASPL
jgi:hypothetical protein